MHAAPGLHCGFGDLLGAETLAAVRTQGFTIPRITANKPDPVDKHHAKNMATPERCRELAQEVVSAGLQPLLSLVRAEQVALLPGGTLVEAGNEGDIEKFGWEPKTDKYAKEFDRIWRACDAHPHTLKCYGGVISNPHRRGFDFLKKIPWASIPKHVGCSIHWYPTKDGGLPTTGHDARSREQEVAAVRKIVGEGRPVIVSEIGYHSNGWHESQIAEHMAWERRFWSRMGFEIVVGYQIQDGPPEDHSNDARYGWRRFGSVDDWKPVAAAFVGAVTSPPVVTSPQPLPPAVTQPAGARMVTFKSDHGQYLCAELDGRIVANRPDANDWEHFHIEPRDGGRIAIKTAHGFYLTAELDDTVRCRTTTVGEWEEWTAVDDDGRVALQSHHGKFLTAELNGDVKARAAALGPWERWISDPAGWWLQASSGTARPLKGPLRVENKLFRDDTGFRRVFFCSWFPALRILRDNPAEFERQIQAIADAGYQGFRTFFVVGGWSTYWDGREVAPITFQKWFHSRETGFHRPASLGATIQAWPDYDDLLRTLLRACKARGLRLHQAVGDMQIICPDAAGKQKELDLNRRFARICAEEGGLEVMALVGDTNEYPQNRYGSDSPESIEQMGRVLRVWDEAIPGVLTTMGAAISEEPERLFQSITHGDVCAVHTSRGAPPYTQKRTHALIHMEGHWRSFPTPFWQGEPMGWGPAVSVDRFDNYTNADGVALFFMHALTGQGSVYFNGPAIHARAPLESTWGFRELPKILAVLPEDVATWEHGNAGNGAIHYWWKGQDFATSTHKTWNLTPPRPIANWTLYTGDAIVTGTGTPSNVTGGLVGRFS